ncbi:hypothetical protein [Microbacterium sp. No. 7]|uniref:hypothetical protein n=1 Tax=Microbacterium sp. No. 7 TaxID=1714373 RepID=UPI0012E1C3AC|nr:hypothetical protein [Microbacterium sp. No. 7]
MTSMSSTLTLIGLVLQLLSVVFATMALTGLWKWRWGERMFGRKPPPQILQAASGGVSFWKLGTPTVRRGYRSPIDRMSLFELDERLTSLENQIVSLRETTDKRIDELSDDLKRDRDERRKADSQDRREQEALRSREAAWSIFLVLGLLGVGIVLQIAGLTIPL